MEVFIMEITVTKTTTPKQKPQDQSKLGFGNYYTDHMFIMNYDEGKGWNNPRIVPYAPIPLDPAAMCLHYGQEVFEGMKAYKTADGSVQLFRPEKNMARLNVSNERLCIPLIDEAFCVEAIKKLVEIDADWIPTAAGTSLYIRPFIFAVDPHVGVHPAHHLMFVVILSPVGAYYPNGLNPVDIYVEQKYVRAVKGGMGFTKTAGNYAASLKAQDEAEKIGYTQVLWLDGVERKYIEEVGTMNVFFVIGDEVVTPELSGSILSGITRMSTIELLRNLGYKVTERKISVQELFDAHDKGELKEAFGTGTAAVISPIGTFEWDGRKITVADGGIGKISQMLYDTITGIQCGRIEDKYGWTLKVC
jgi:branched-chain amino acid aminotransferase